MGDSPLFGAKASERLGLEEAVGVVADAVDARNCGERNTVERLDLERSVVTRNPQCGEDIVDVVDAVGRDDDTLVLRQDVP